MTEENKSDPTQSVKECCYGAYSDKDELCFNLDWIANDKSRELQERHVERMKIIARSMMGMDIGDIPKLYREAANDCNTIILDAVRDTKDRTLDLIDRRIDDNETYTSQEIKDLIKEMR